MDSLEQYKVYPLGENAITFDFGNLVSNDLNDSVLALAAKIESNPFVGFIECVPAYSSLTIFFDIVKTKQKFRTAVSAFEIVKSFIEIEMQMLPALVTSKPDILEIPVSFEPEVALDLDFVAKSANMSTNKVLELFLAKDYRVFMLGFLPGFPYMGEVDQRIATPRKTSPRTRVPKGSIGIAGRQTGIYPLESPGGWQIIGRTNVELFTPKEKNPTRFRAGDIVKFIKA